MPPSWHDYADTVTWVMQALLVAIVVVAVVVQSVGAFVNASLALLVTFLPPALERDMRVTLSPWLTLWLTGAVLLHSLGMLGLYESVQGYDHLTHVLSATLVAGAGYAITHAVDLHVDEIYLPDRFLTVFVVLVTMAAGVLWEVLEFGVHSAAASIGMEPILIQYGVADTVGDLFFDLVGGLLVAVFGTGPLANTVETIVAVLEDGVEGR